MLGVTNKMNIHQLNKPSLAEIRANLITEQLKNLPPNSSYINVFLTGRSASGKTTLGNRLIGESYFLSTGRQNTTQVVNLIDFSGGFRFFDLPGVDGGGRQEGGRLENYNRAALGLKQVPSYPNIDEITVAIYRKNSLPQEHTYKLNDFEKLPFKPDIAFYLIDPKKDLSRSEKDYVIDLIESGHNVIYILNVWIDKYHKPLATEQNFEDTEKSIKDIYFDLQKKKEPVIVRINCQTGQGIDSLLQQASLSLGDARGLVFKQIILAQHQKAPEIYIDLIKQELSKIFADAAYYEPKSYDDAKEKLKNTSRLLWDYLASLSLYEQEDSPNSNFQRIINSYSDFEKIINTLIKTVINSVKTDHYTPVAVSVPFCEVIYEDVQLYGNKTEIVDDLDNPIYETKRVTTDPGIWGGIGNKLQGKEWENVYYKEEFTGKFRQKQINKKVRIGTKKEFSDIEIWWDLIGLKKYSYSVYKPFELYGVCFLKCLCLAMVNSNFQDTSQFKKYIYSYYLYLKVLTKGEKIGQIINNINLILDQKDFDLPATAIFVENSQVSPKLRLLLSFSKELTTRILFELNNFKALAIRIVFCLKETFLEGDNEQQIDSFGIQCRKLIACYSKFVLLFSWELYKFLRGKFTDS
jgi:GTPase Era involved in 16S rRNA processing